MSELNCWKCGASLKTVLEPFGQRADCPACNAELHVCRMCRHFLPGKAKQCMEPMAEDIKDKTRANFCDWFQAGQNKAGKTAGSDNRSALDDLFGGGSETSATTPENARKALDDLFG
ncbi:MAG: hypothetical protein P4L70_09390 [Parasulfuritortus sp.]|nr:hypothetical protein [Parasulfuritortus sp.]